MVAKEKFVSVPAPSSAQLALAVLLERIQSLPKEDKDDLFELSKTWFTTDDEEERQSVRTAMEEILEQQPSGIVPMAITDNPGDELESYVAYVSDKIREKRKAAGLSQQELEEKSGLPQSHISRLENGQHSPSFVTLEKIARALGIPVSDLEPCV